MKILSAEIVASAPGPAQFPTDGLPEVAFLGRSNVGKSSLLNRLVARKQLARTSGTPGKTRLLHFFQIKRPEGELLFVDLPGYGFAKVSKGERVQWRGMIEGYLENREPLRVAVLLQDARRDPRDDERLLIAWLAARRIPTLLAITKLDKLKARERDRRLAMLRVEMPVQADWQIPTSAKTGQGIAALWQAIDGLL